MCPCQSTFFQTLEGKELVSRAIPHCPLRVELTVNQIKPEQGEAGAGATASVTVKKKKEANQYSWLHAELLRNFDLGFNLCVHNQVLNPFSEADQLTLHISKAFPVKIIESLAVFSELPPKVVRQESFCLASKLIFP